MNALVHVANVLFLVSYLVRDILWLRGLTIVAIATLIPYYLANDLWPPIIWNGVFVAINVYQMVRLLIERRPCHLDERQQQLYQRVFRTLQPREFLALAQLGTWRSVAPGEQLVAEGEVLDQLHVIEAGTLEVLVGERSVAELNAGSFVGEMSFLTGEPTSARVIANAGEPRAVEVLSWPREGLRAFLDGHPDTRAALQLILGTDMAAKLRAG